MGTRRTSTAKPKPKGAPGALLSFRSTRTRTPPLRMNTRAPNRTPHAPIAESPTPRPASTAHPKRTPGPALPGTAHPSRTAHALASGDGDHPTPAQAATFVRLLTAGIPKLEALAYCTRDCPAPTSTDHERTRLQTWGSDPHVVHAVRAANGGEWADLAIEKQTALALDKHLAELAYFVYSHSFENADPATLTKLQDARRALAESQARTGKADSPYAKWLRETTDGLPDLDLPTLPASTATPGPSSTADPRANEG